MESEGLKVGVRFCLFCASAISLAVAWRGSPLGLWLVEKTESYENYCWWGEGIFETFVHWGGASGSHSKCYSPTQAETGDAVDAYCSTVVAPRDGSHRRRHHENDAEVGYSMCATVYAARALSVMGIIFAMAAFILAMSQDELARRLALWRRNRGVTPPADTHVVMFAKARILIRKLMVLLTLIAITLDATLLIVMITSPMFSGSHFAYLGRNNAVPYDGLGCKFQSPFLHGIVGLLQNHPLKCLYPGLAIPAMVATLVLLLMGMSIGLYSIGFPRVGLILKRTHSVQPGAGVEGHNVNHEDEESEMNGRPSSRHEDTASYTNHRGSAPVEVGVEIISSELLPPAPVLSPSPPDYHLLEEEETEEQQRNGEFATNRTDDEAARFVREVEKRRYSLHGALMRRLHDYHPVERMTLSLLVPAFAVSNAVVLVIWFYGGMQFLVHVKVHNAKLGGEEHNAPSDMLQLTIVELTEQVFTFDPVTSLRMFWGSGATLMTIVTAFWLDFFPFFKITVWAYFWFVPHSEVTRGRVLTWFDYLGKWTLANLLVLILIAVAFLFYARISIPLPLPGMESIAVDVTVQYAQGKGVTLFVVSMIWTVFLGNFFLEVHSRAKSWEERRREAGEASALFPTSRVPLGSTTPNSNPLIPSSLSSQTTTTDPPSNPNNPNNTTLNMTETATTLMSSATLSLPRTLGEVVKRANRRFASLNELIRPSPELEKEALCYHAFTPIPNGKRHHFSMSGRLVVFVCISILFAASLAGILTTTIEYDRSGAIGNYLVEKKDRVRAYNLLDLADGITDSGGPNRPRTMAFFLLAFCVVFPLLHILGLYVTWFYPMTRNAQLTWFRIMEFLDAWAVLDVLCFAIFLDWLGLESISIKIVEQVVPGLTAAVRLLVPNENNLYKITPTMKQGFWWLLFAMVGEKLLTHSLMSLSALAIAQREKRERTLSRLRGQKKSLASSSSSGAAQGGGGTNDVSLGDDRNASSRLPSNSEEHDAQDEEEEEDGFASITETEIAAATPLGVELYMFSPASRYMGVSGDLNFLSSNVRGRGGAVERPHRDLDPLHGGGGDVEARGEERSALNERDRAFYAGIPTWVWKGGVLFGLMRENQ